MIISKIKKFLQGEDEKRLILNILMAFFIKGLSLIVSFYSMPLYIKYFNNESVLGVWYTVLSFLSWISICDLGLGNGLRNRFLDSYYKNDVEKGKKIVSSTYFSMILISFFVLILGIIVFPFIDFNEFLNISTEIINPSVLKISIFLLFIGIILNFILKIINSILYSIQKSSINNIIALVSSVLPLISIAFIPTNLNSSDNFLILSIIHSLSINIPLVLATVIVFSTACKKFKPNINFVDKKTAIEMLFTGMKFFFAQIFFMLLMSTNEVFITRLFAPDYVVEYNVYYKIFMTVGSLFMLALTPLWSQVTKYYSEKNFVKIRKTNKFLLFISFIAIVSEFLLILVLQGVINIWLGDDAIIVNNLYSIIFALYGGVYILNIVSTTVANGVGELKTQVIFYSIGSILKLPAIILSKLVFDNWIIVVIYNSLFLILFCIFQFVFINRYLKKEENKNGIVYK